MSWFLFLCSTIIWMINLEINKFIFGEWKGWYPMAFQIKIFQCCLGIYVCVIIISDNQPWLHSDSTNQVGTWRIQLYVNCCLWVLLMMHSLSMRMKWRVHMTYLSQAWSYILLCSRHAIHMHWVLSLLEEINLIQRSSMQKHFFIYTNNITPL